MMATDGFDGVYVGVNSVIPFLESLRMTLRVLHRLGDYCRGVDPGYPRVDDFVESIEKRDNK